MLGMWVIGPSTCSFAYKQKSIPFAFLRLYLRVFVSNKPESVRHKDSLSNWTGTGTVINAKNKHANSDTFFVCVCQKRCRRLTVRTLAGQIEEGNGLLTKMETCLKGLQSFAAFPTASPINQRARSHQLQPSRVDMCRLSCDELACIMAQLLV